MATASETISRPRALDYGFLLREAGMVAGVVFALTVAVVGLKTEDVPGGLDIVTRFVDVFAATIIAFFGRIALILLRERRPLPVLLGSLPLAILMLLALLSEQLSMSVAGLGRDFPFDSIVVNWLLTIFALLLAGQAGWGLWHAASTKSAAEREKTMDRIGAGVQKVALLVGPLLLVFAIILPFLPFADRRLLDIAVLVATYIMLGWGLNIVVGLAGLLDLGYVAFYAVGAYSYALLATHFELSFWICLPFAGIMAAFAGILLGFPVLRLRGDYLAIVTLGFGEMIRIILLNWYKFTNGPDGISGIPQIGRAHV